MEKVIEWISLIFFALTILCIVIFGSGFVLPLAIEVFINKEMAMYYAYISAYCYLLSIAFAVIGIFFAVIKAKAYPQF